MAGWRIQDVTFQDYFGRPLPADACLPELRREFAAPQKFDCASGYLATKWDDLKEILENA